MLDVRKLRYFATVAELGSFTKAAQVLHVAQPALSRQVQHLEKDVGIALFRREGRHIRLTDAGETMLRHARTIDRDFERLLEEMQNRNGPPKGKVVLGVPPTLANTIVPRVVSKLRANFPLITLTILEGLTPVLAEWIRCNKADLAILSFANETDATLYPALSNEPIATEEMVVAEKRASRRRQFYSLPELRNRELIVSGMLADIVQKQIGGSKGFRRIMEIDSVQALKTMVLRGQATSILPISMLTDELRSGRVSATSITRSAIYRQVVLVHPSFRQMTQAAEAIRRLVRDEMREMEDAGTFVLHKRGRKSRAIN